MSKMFWIVLAALVGAAVHIAYVLFVPSIQFQSHLESLGGKPGTWRLIGDDERFSMLPGFSGSGVAAACPIDLKPGKMELSVHVPQSYWVLSIYSQTGRQVYSLNDKQAGAESFSINVSRAKSFIEQIFSTGDTDEAAGAITNAAWNVVLPDRRGIAVLWIPSSSDAMRPALAQMIGKSSCKTAVAAAQ